MVAKRFFTSLGHGLLWIVLAYVVWGLIIRHRYNSAWNATKVGDSIPVVMMRFGAPDLIQSALRYSQPDFCARPNEKCPDSYAFRLWYELPFTAIEGAHVLVVAFDDHLRVVEKFEMSSP